MSSMFVSYSARDRDRVAPLIAALEPLCERVFWDVDIRGGSRWRAAVDMHLTNAKLAVVIWSRNSVASDWVKYEAAQSLARCTLFPIVIDQVEVPDPFSDLQEYRLIGWPDTKDEEIVDRLLDSVREVLAGADFPTSTLRRRNALLDLCAKSRAMLLEPEHLRALDTDVVASAYADADRIQQRIVTILEQSEAALWNKPRLVQHVQDTLDCITDIKERLKGFRISRDAEAHLEELSKALQVFSRSHIEPSTKSTRRGILGALRRS